MKYKVIINLAAGTSDGLLCHEFVKEAESEIELFKAIANSEWYTYTRNVKFHNRPDLNNVYHEFIQTKYIADLCIMKEIKLK